MGLTTRTPEGRVRTGVTKIIVGYVQPIRPTDDRMTSNGKRFVKRSIRVPMKDHPKGGVFHDVQSVDERIAAQLADMPGRALVRVTGAAKVDVWRDKDGNERTTEVCWVDAVEVLELDTRDAAPPASAYDVVGTHDDIPF